MSKIFEAISSFFKGISSLLDVIKAGLSLGFILVIAWLVLYLAGNFKSITTKWIGSEKVTSVAQSDQVITSIAQLDVLKIKKNGRWFSEISDGVFNNASAFCLNTYSIAFGYASANKVEEQFTEDKVIPFPDIIAINSVRSEAGPDKYAKECDEFNLQTRRKSLKSTIIKILDKQDHVLNEHYRQGRFALASFIDLNKEDCFTDSPSKNCALAVLSDELNADKKTYLSDKDKNTRDIQESRATIEKGLARSISEMTGAEQIEVSMKDSDDTELFTTGVKDLIKRGMPASEKPRNIKKEEKAITDYTEKALSDRSGRAINTVKIIESAKKTGLQAVKNNEYAEKEIKQINRILANIQSGMASLTVTVSMVAGVSKHSEYFWGLFNFDDFLIKRDVAKVIYGSYISALPFFEQSSDMWSLFSEEKVVEIPSPTILAIDRWTSLLAEKGNISGDRADKNTVTVSARLNAQILSLLDNAIRRVNDQAVNASKAIITNRILLRFPDKRLNIKFRSDARTDISGMFHFKNLNTFQFNKK